MLLRMRAKRFSFFSLAVSLWLSFALSAQQKAAVAVVIQVTDATGNTIPHAQVRIIPAPDAASKLETDSKGQLALALKSGGYAIFVRVPGFKNAVAHLDVVNADLPRSSA